MTQTQLAASAELSKSYLSRLESGAVLRPGTEIVQRLARALDTTVNEIAAPAENQDVVGKLLDAIQDVRDLVSKRATGDQSRSARSTDAGTNERNDIARVTHAATRAAARSEFREAAAHYSELVGLLEHRAGESLKLVRVLLAAIDPNYVLGNHSTCIRYALEALDVLDSVLRSEGAKAAGNSIQARFSVPELRTRCLIWLAGLHDDVADYPRALRYATEAYETGIDMFNSTRELALAHLSLGNWHDADELLQRVLVIATKKENGTAGVVHSNIANLRLMQQRADEAVFHCQESLRLRYAMARSTRSSEQKVGQLADGALSVAAHVATGEASSETRGIAYCLTYLADAYLIDPERVPSSLSLAEVYLHSAYGLFKQIGDLRNAAETDYRYALLLDKRGDRWTALQLADSFVSYFEGKSFRLEPARGKRLVGKLRLRAGDDSGEVLLRESVHDLEQIGNKFELAQSMFELGSAMAAKEEASVFLRRSIRLFEELGMERTLVYETAQGALVQRS